MDRQQISRANLYSAQWVHVSFMLRVVVLSASRVCVRSAEAYRLSKAHLPPCANNQKQQDKNMKTRFTHLQCPWPALEPQSVAEMEFGSHLGQSPCFQFPFSFSPTIPDDPPKYNTHAHTQEIMPHNNTTIKKLSKADAKYQRLKTPLHQGGSKVIV